MKNIILIVVMLLGNQAMAQHFTKEKTEIKKIVKQFKESIIRKDSTTFYSLFHEDPVVWIGVVKNRSQQKRLEKNPGNGKNFFSDTYKNFFRYIMETGVKEETFENIRIINDDVIASVTFNYSFREGKDTTNWGSEYWHLIKAQGQWKIASIIYSYEDAKIFPRVHDH